MDSSIITIPNITFALGIIGILFTIYTYFRDPQIKSDKDATRLEDRVSSIEKTVNEIKETHLRTVENDIRSLTTQIGELSKTVIKLATIIDERIPRKE